jgi:hypothetical protein
MRTHLGGIAALVVGACGAWSCGGGGGGGGGEDESVDPPTVVGSKGGTGQTVGAGADSPSSAPVAAGTTPGAAGAPPAGTGTPPGGEGTATPAAAGAASPAGTAAPASSAGAALVPLYTYPSDPSWDTVIAAKAVHPTVGVVAVVNPANGPGGAVDPGYASGIARLNAAGIKVLGYVATGYAVNDPGAVKANIDRWRTFYPGQIGGIFFDEQSVRAGDIPYYRDLSQYAKAQGLSFTVGNPGMDTAEGYVGALDMMLIYENAGLPTVSQLGGWHANHAPSNFGVIPHSAQMDAGFVHEARRYVQYIYVQNDTLPNPWDTVPASFGNLLAALE